MLSRIRDWMGAGALAELKTEADVGHDVGGGSREDWPGFETNVSAAIPGSI